MQDQEVGMLFFKLAAEGPHSGETTLFAPFDSLDPIDVVDREQDRSACRALRSLRGRRSGRRAADEDGDPEHEEGAGGGEESAPFSVIPSVSEGSGWAGGLESLRCEGICATLPPDSSLSLGMTGGEGFSERDVSFWRPAIENHEPTPPGRAAIVAAGW
jgi:hypothetical protein